MRQAVSAFFLAFLLSVPATALAHFGMVIPSSDTVTQREDLSLVLSFSHPMERVGMELAKPASFKVYATGKAEDLTGTLTPASILGNKGWQTSYAVRRPGVYSFVMEPQPYWEEAEESFIIHYTRTVVGAFGDEEGWDQPLGLRTEIVPLTRPFGNYAGNTFVGQVLLDGKPVPGASVEVEYYNETGERTAPNPYLVTQVVKSDPNGIFVWTVPFAGWWGFAALNTAPETLKHEGVDRPVELGAVIWTKFLDPARSLTSGLPSGSAVRAK